MNTPEDWDLIRRQLYIHQCQIALVMAMLGERQEADYDPEDLKVMASLLEDAQRNLRDLASDMMGEAQNLKKWSG